MLLPPFLVELEGGRIDWIMVQVFFVRPIALSKIFFCIQLTPNLSCFARSTVSPCVSEHASSCLSSLSPASFQKPPSLSLSLSLSRPSVCRTPLFCKFLPNVALLLCSCKRRNGLGQRRVRRSAGCCNGQSLAPTFLHGVANDDAANWSFNRLSDPPKREDSQKLRCIARGNHPTSFKSPRKGKPHRLGKRVQVVGERENQFSPVFRRRCPKIHSCSSSLSFPPSGDINRCSLSLCRPVLMLGVITNEM